MENTKLDGNETLTLGSIFAGIGGFELGFERAGFKTRWQIEINPAHRVVLAHGFPSAVQHGDVREVDPATLEKVACIIAGFPCQDISNSGAGSQTGRQGLRGGA